MADLRLTELLKVLDLAALREKRHTTEMMKLVVRQYRAASMTEVTRQLREALDAPGGRSAQARTDLVLKALDIAVKELKLPPQRAEQMIRQAVQGRIQNLDELMRLQNPQLSFNDPREVQARAVAVARKDMNTYWAHEQRRFRNDVARTTRQAIRAGMTPDQAAGLLEQRLKVSRNRAVLIATDQMLTAQANADRARQKDMGIEEYLWRTVGDARVRPEHRARDRHRYRWDNGGEYPGQAIRCRCRAVPIIRTDAAAAGHENVADSPKDDFEAMLGDYLPPPQTRFEGIHPPFTGNDMAAIRKAAQNGEIGVTSDGHFRMRSGQRAGQSDIRSVLAAIAEARTGEYHKGRKVGSNYQHEGYLIPIVLNGRVFEIKIVRENEQYALKTLIGPIR